MHRKKQTCYQTLATPINTIISFEWSWLYKSIFVYCRDRDTNNCQFRFVKKQKHTPLTTFALITSSLLYENFLSIWKRFLLTLPVPCISESCIEIRIKLNFCFHTSLWCVKEVWGTTKKCVNKDATFSGIYFTQFIYQLQRLI